MIEERAPAKVNLSLRVTGRRADGYHDLESLVVFAGAADRLTAAPAGMLALDVTGPFAAALAGETGNLVLRAARMLREQTGETRGARLGLEKNLPVASGIGGGSADAAAALRALARLWGRRLETETLASLALCLGADVPVCLDTAPALMWGRGEKIARLSALPPFWLVLANPGLPVATASVFRALAAPACSGLRPSPRLPSFGTLDQLLAWLGQNGNDLEAPAIGLVPEIAGVLEAMRAAPGCRLARMSGSGATCFGIFAAEAAARGAARLLAAAHPAWWVAAAERL